MVQSRFKQKYAKTVQPFLVLFVVLALGLFFSPWIHQVATSVLALRGDGGGEYALLPRAVLIERLRTAEDELQNVRYQAVVYEHITRTLNDLQSEMHMRVPEAHMTARVMAVPPRSPYDTLLILGGEEDGVGPSDIAMVEGVALGEVAELYPYTSVVELYSAPGVERDGQIRDGGTIIIRGAGGGAFEAIVPDDVDVSVGDTVDRKSTRLNSSHVTTSRMPSSA